MNGTTLNAIDLPTTAVISPEAFASDPTNITIQDINSCLAFASANNVTIMARGNYTLTESITMNSVRWIGGKFSAGANITGTELIQPVAAGLSYIQTANYDWSQSSHLKNAGTRLIIPGAGENGSDLLTTITNGTYVRGGGYTLDIEPAIQTTLTTTTAIHAAYPVEYSEINL
jgi:hypothetical protein